MDPPDGGARFTVSGASVLALLGYARRRGFDCDDALARVGLTLADLSAPESRVTQAANDVIYDAVAARVGDADLGLHFAEALDLSGFHVVGHLASHSATFGEALARIVAPSRLLHDAGRVEVERDGDCVRVFPGCRGLPQAWPRHIAEFSAATVLVLGRCITGQAWSARAVSLKHPRPPRVSEHLRVFGVLPSFGRPETEVVLDRAVLDLPVVSASRGLSTYLDAYARELVGRLPTHDDVVDQVHRAVAVSLARAVPDIDAVAAQLATTPRTLQCRLASRDTSFQAIVERVRQEFAERYLLDPTVNLQEVGFLVGFSDPSNFHRAFRRWTGQTPGEYRRARCRAATTA